MNVYKTKTRRVRATQFAENISFYYPQLKIVQNAATPTWKRIASVNLKLEVFILLEGIW